MLVYSHDDFSACQVDKMSKDLKKKIKIFVYLRKLLTSEKPNDVNLSLVPQTRAQYDSTVVYLKKWSYVGAKLVFKLNTKMMQIVCGSPNKVGGPKSPTTSEIIFKYDVGHIMHYTHKGRSKVVTVSKADKRVIFSNSKGLDEKLSVIENLVQNPSHQMVNATPRTLCENRNTSAQSSRFDVTKNERSIYGFTPVQKKQNSHNIRQSRYKPKRKMYETHQSLSYTPFKDLTSKTSSYMGNAASSFNKAFLNQTGVHMSSNKNLRTVGLPPTSNSGSKPVGLWRDKYSELGTPRRFDFSNLPDQSTITTSCVRSKRNYSKESSVFRNRR